MSITVRVLLLIGALSSFVYVFLNIRKSKMKAEEAFFWIGTAGLLVVLAVFPGFATWLSWVIGIESPANLVFLVVIFLLVMKIFLLDRKLAAMRHQMTELIQNTAIRETREKQGKPEQK